MPALEEVRQPAPEYEVGAEARMLVEVASRVTAECRCPRRLDRQTALEPSEVSRGPAKFGKPGSPEHDQDICAASNRGALRRRVVDSSSTAFRIVT